MESLAMKSAECLILKSGRGGLCHKKVLMSYDKTEFRGTISVHLKLRISRAVHCITILVEVSITHQSATLNFNSLHSTKEMKDNVSR